MLSENTANDFNYYYVRFENGRWKQTIIAPSNHKWNSCYLNSDNKGALYAYLITGTVNKQKEKLEKQANLLKQANEELNTTNEELQATNEELQTANEELQSTNEELMTVKSPGEVIRAVAESERWIRRPSVALGVISHQNTPGHVALRLLPRVPRHPLITLLDRDELPRIVAVRVRRMLSGEGPEWSR